ncbi:hypothetical protein O181_071434 [Austropuccinia psidii MF-1]|uniref:Integrase zinc-binding domain-containing protein n=1 Tax=Austropuccinia psidii MF-1 TaxID=1389203 RepID=A0A9Q3F2R9_9BASI|nr:hypothetical protein [Austropuccinia psidii MF-1]
MWNGAILLYDTQSSPYKLMVQANVNNIGKVDLILGMPWLRATDAWVGGRSAAMKIGCKVFTGALALTPSIVQNSLLFKNTDPALPQGKATYNVPSFLSPFLSIFYDEGFPSTLPPHRPGFDCVIKLKPNCIASFGGLYHLSCTENMQLRTYLDDLLKKGFIRLSSSPAEAPIFFVKVPGREDCPCVDYRGLNSVTVHDSYPIPHLSLLLDNLQGCKFLAKLDLKAAFNLLRVDPSSVPLTAFRTPWGLYKYLVMLFGLANAHATFQNSLQHILRKNNPADPPSQRSDFYSPFGSNNGPLLVVSSSGSLVCSLSVGVLDTNRPSLKQHDPYFVLPSPSELAQLLCLSKDYEPSHADVWRDSQGFLWHNARLFVPSSGRGIIFSAFHASRMGGHQGLACTLSSITRTFSWPGLQKELLFYTTTCDSCQRAKAIQQPPPGFLKSIPISSQPWSIIGMDFVVKLPCSHGYDSILVIVDTFTKGAHFIPCMESMDAPALASLFLDCFYILAKCLRKIGNQAHSIYSLSSANGDHKSKGQEVTAPISNVDLARGQDLPPTTTNKSG